ncbi:hypothetical protein CEXT_207231 [Caerostris extrusa]|uniref:Uncharacterized protein n=1 Tax=Caerostris extrusa TaxID=172846 RepID=A0AAV4S927_CAEEX|nr:hypothetical protein CEXT_207231 [Caerostris extrusa]
MDGKLRWTARSCPVDRRNKATAYRPGLSSGILWSQSLPYLRSILLRSSCWCVDLISSFMNCFCNVEGGLLDFTR